MADKILATFRIDPEEWEDFKKQSSADGSSASAVLIDLVRWYREGNRISRHAENPSFNLDKIDARLHNLIDIKLDEIGIKPVDSELIQGMVKRELERIDKPLDNPALQEMIKQELESAIADFRQELDERLGELAA